MQAIESATRVPAESMGLGKDSGTIEPGKRADLIVLNADPLAQISNIRKLRWVVDERTSPRTRQALGRGRIQMTLTRRSFLAALLVCSLAACREAPPLPAERAILILISIDGFRWDYLDKLQPADAAPLAAEGVQADGLIPQFPSKTFPNHYTIVTGLTLAHHGIISNNMRDADIPGEFSMSNRDVLADPRWWGGEPIWNTAEKQGRKAGAMFWPGSETVIGGRQATYWTPFDNDMPNSERVKRVLGWLTLPESERPSFLTLYFSDVDNAGHSQRPRFRRGARTPSCSVDKSIGDLVAGVKAAGLDDRVHYVDRQRSRHGRAQPRSHDRAGRLTSTSTPRMSWTGRRCSR